MAHWTGQILDSNKDTSQTSAYEDKLEVARKLCEIAKSGQVIGAGSGSTALIALSELARRDCEEGLNLSFIPTSREIEWACLQARVKMVSLNEARPDWCFDGADEVDASGNMIKGRGGAMYREKLVMSASEIRYILVDESKFVSKLGEKFAVPVEYDPAATQLVEKRLRDLGAKELKIRMAGGKDGPVITESGFAIMDARFDEITPDMESGITSIPGVLESGLFSGYNPEFPGHEGKF